MGLRTKGARWIWLALVIVVTGWEALRQGVSWVTLSPVLIAIVFVSVAFALRLREGPGDERTRRAVGRALATGFVATVVAGVACVALVVPHALLVSLDAGMVAFLGAYLGSRFAGAWR